MSTSTGELQEIVTLLREIQQLLQEPGGLTPAELQHQQAILQTQITLLTSTLTLTRRLTGSGNLANGILIMQTAISTMRQLQVAGTMLMASNPWLFALGVVGLMGTAVTIYNTGSTLQGY